MNKGLIGKKLGMTQVYDKAGNLHPVTVIGLTERPVAQGGNSGANVILQDTLVTRVLLRNAPR